MKQYWLVLSPHLDDAAFSLGPLIASATMNCAVTVATAFTASVAEPSGFALACQTDKGLPVEADYMALRRQEDIKWASQLNTTTHHGPLPEAPHRGYNSAEALFSGIHGHDRVGEALTGWLSQTIAEFTPDLVFVPLGVGNHVDHLWLRHAAETALPDGLAVIYYQDQPYCWKRRHSPKDLSQSHAKGLAIHRLIPNRTAVHRALNANECYATQIPFQFGSCTAMHQQLRQAWEKSLLLFPNESAAPHTAQISQQASQAYARS
jgi:LmbE family N-acetylglucosaminyl deacetylase